MGGWCGDYLGRGCGFIWGSRRWCTGGTAGRMYGGSFSGSARREKAGSSRRAKRAVRNDNLGTWSKLMELLDRYLQAVRFWLPKAQQEDIIAELSSDLRSQID